MRAKCVTSPRRWASEGTFNASNQERHSVYKTLNLSPKIKLIVSDFDGIFTDNSVYIFDDGNSAKKLSYKDIMGVSVAIKNGISVAILSGSESTAISYLAEKFPLAGAYQNIKNKLPVLEDIMKEHNLCEDEVLYLGDDVNDIECLCKVNYPVTVREANKNVLELEQIQITQANPGNGAFREVVDNLVELKFAELKNYEKNSG